MHPTLETMADSVESDDAEWTVGVPSRTLSVVVITRPHSVSADLAESLGRERQLSVTSARLVHFDSGPQILAPAAAVSPTAPLAECTDKAPGPAQATDVVVAFSKDLLKGNSTFENFCRASKECGATRVVILTDCSIHLGNSTSGRDEELMTCIARRYHLQCLVIRTGLILSRHSAVSRILTGQFWLQPLIPSQTCGTFLRIEELAHALADEIDDEEPSDVRRITMLGQRWTWNDVFRDHAGESIFPQVLWGVACLMHMCGFSLLLAAVSSLAYRIRPRWRIFSFQVIQPKSEAELLELCNRHNHQHIQICGYNNGVTHFGWRFPRQTVIPTTKICSQITVEGNELLAGSGVTLHECMNALSPHGKEFCVVPNYTYIAVGTTFFVPVHGSGSRITALGDTILSIRYWDPCSETVAECHRGEPLFDRLFYNRDSGIVLLSLKIRVQDRSGYQCVFEEQTHPDAEFLWAVLSDTGPDNIEIRKRSAAESAVAIMRYYRQPREQASLDMPRDRLGSLWDRLEENRLTAFLFHWLVRSFAFHVELFLNQTEFDAFWRLQNSLPLKKIQLRFARSDGMTHSPFGDADRVTIDLLMNRKHREAFLKFVRVHLPDARFNPGKQTA